MIDSHYYSDWNTSLRCDNSCELRNTLAKRFWFKVNFEKLEMDPLYTLTCKQKTWKAWVKIGAIAEYSPHSLVLQKTALNQTKALTLMSVNKTWNSSLAAVGKCGLYSAVAPQNQGVCLHGQLGDYHILWLGSQIYWGSHYLLERKLVGL